MLQSNNKSLLLVSPQLPFPVDNGGREAIHGALVELAKNYEITFIYFGETHSEVHKIKNVTFMCLGELKSTGFMFILKCLLSLKHYKFEKYFNDQCKTLQLPEKHYDAVISFHPHVSKCTETLLKFNNIKNSIKILRSMNVESKIVDLYIRENYTSIYYVLLPIIYIATRHEKNIWRKYDKIIHISDADYSEASKLIDGRVASHSVVYDGIDHPRFPFKKIFNESDKKIILPVNLSAEQNRLNLKTFLLKYWQPIARDLRGRLKLTITGANGDNVKKIIGPKNYQILKGTLEPVGFVRNYDEFINGNLVISATFVGAGMRKKITRAISNDAAILMSDYDFCSVQYFSHLSNATFASPAEFSTLIREFEKNKSLFVARQCKLQRELIKRYSWANFANEVECLLNPL